LACLPTHRGRLGRRDALKQANSLLRALRGLRVKLLWRSAGFAPSPACRRLACLCVARRQGAGRRLRVSPSLAAVDHRDPLPACPSFPRRSSAKPSREPILVPSFLASRESYVARSSRNATSLRPAVRVATQGRNPPESGKPTLSLGPHAKARSSRRGRKSLGSVRITLRFCASAVSNDWGDPAGGCTAETAVNAEESDILFEFSAFFRGSPRLRRPDRDDPDSVGALRLKTDTRRRTSASR